MASDKLVVVTGGAGFIGSHTVDLLVKKGYRVRILDSLQPRVHPKGKPSWVSSEAEFVHGDVADRGDLEGALKGADYVVHLAAYQDYMPDFSRFINVNSGSSALIFELILADPRKFPVQKVVFASSQSVSGEGRYFCSICADGISAPTIEEQLREPALSRELPSRAVFTPDPRSIDQLRAGDWEIHCPLCSSVMQPLLIDEATVSPGTAYGISKYAIELLADRLGRRCGVPTACMRYTYVQGPRNSFYNSYSGVARRFALNLMHNLPPVVYEDGGQLRDFVNVHDVARANVLALEDERANYGVFNVGGSRAVTVLEFARMMLKEFKSDLEPRIPRAFRIGDTRHTISDTSALRALGWTPTVPVEQNVTEYAEWIKQQRGTKEYLEEAERVMQQQGVIQHATV